MALDSKRAIVQKTPSDSGEYQVRFEPHRFDALIHDKGYDVFIDRAFRCPCAVKNSSQPLSDCMNCLGAGWIFTNRIETRIAMQSLKADIRFDNWSKNTAGTAKVTARAIDKLAFMDRIILREVEGYFNEILRSVVVFNDNGEREVFMYTNYGILEIENLMSFVNSEEKLRYLQEGVDYELVDGELTKIKLIHADLQNVETTATIRYRHFQTYHIIDMNRDITKVREKGCAMPDERLTEMPIMGIARKAHYLFDNPKYDEAENLIDNTEEF